MNGGLPTLEVVWSGRRTVVEAPSIAIVGRLPDCAVQIPDATVSGHQGSFEFVGQHWMYRDHRSTNGTWHLGNRVTELMISGPTELRLGGHDGPALGVHPRTSVPAPATPVQNWQPLPAPSLLAPPVVAPQPSADNATTSRWWKPQGPQVATSFTIGRADDVEYQIDDMLVSRTHARLELLVDGTAQMVDLGSVNGTFVDGVRAAPALPLRTGQRVTVGNTAFVFDGQRLGPLKVVGEAVFSIEALTTKVTTKTGPKTLLSDLSFALPKGSLMAVLGPSGAGKSTLLGAITGTRAATSGTVRFSGLDLYRNYGEVRNRIGFVPQDDILHPLLTITTALRHSARLRFPADTTQAERDARISVVLGQLNLTEHASKQICNLSGGQRKRVNVALELLSEPDLLILDEPTSGLDPGNERSVMEQLRALADGGRTVIVVSHSTESLHLCDQVLMLAPGGIAAFQGPVSASLSFLGADDYPQAFQMLEREDPERLRRTFSSSEWGVASRSGVAPKSAQRAVSSSRRSTGPTWAAVHFRTFVTRYIDVLKGDRRGLFVLAMQAPVMALLMLAVFGEDRLIPGPEAAKAGNVLMALVLASIYMGASNSAREIVKERAILRREQSFGVSIAAYLASKAAVLGAITVAQAFVLVYVGTARQGGPTDAVLLSSPRFEMFVAVSICGVSAMMLGLLISASVSTIDKATTILPVMLFAQFLLAGLTFPLDGLGIAQVSLLSSARWGLGAVAATADFPMLSSCRIPGTPTYGICGDWWDHDAGDWLANVVVMLVLTSAFAGFAYLRLRRDDPARALASSS